MTLTPAYLYHDKAPSGVIVNSDEEYHKRLKEGWVDSPAKLAAFKKAREHDVGFISTSEPQGELPTKETKAK